MTAFIHCKDGRRKVEIEDIFRVGDHHFFVHKILAFKEYEGEGDDHYYYAVSEWRTGLRIPEKNVDGIRKPCETIEQAKELIEQRYKESPSLFSFTLEMGKIDYGIVNTGKSPTRKQVLKSIEKGPITPRCVVCGFRYED